MQQNETTTRSEVTVRRSPRYGRFVITTIVIFVIASFFLTYSLPDVGQFSSNQVFGYMILVSIVFGIIVGSILALVIDKLMSRTARTVVAEKTDARVVDAGPGDGEAVGPSAGDGEVGRTADGGAIGQGAGGAHDDGATAPAATTPAATAPGTPAASGAPDGPPASAGAPDETPASAPVAHDGTSER